MKIEPREIKRYSMQDVIPGETYPKQVVIRRKMIEDMLFLFDKSMFSFDVYTLIAGRITHLSTIKNPKSYFEGAIERWKKFEANGDAVEIYDVIPLKKELTFPA